MDDDLADSGNSTELILENKNVVVEKVHILGLRKTKADYVVNEVKSVFKSKTFLQAYKEAIKCQAKLMSKGIFKNVDIWLDTTEAYENASKNGIQVIFNAVERNFVVGEVKTEMSNREKPRWVMRLLCPNVLGRGESLSTSLSHTLLSSASHIYQPTDFYTSFSKPCGRSKLQATVLKEKQEYTWTSFNETVRGAEIGYEFPFMGNMHTISWNGSWRELACAAPTTSFLIRKQMGHSLKSSLAHSIVIDKTDDHLLPRSGVYLKFNEEVAGFGGDVRFLKENFESQVAFSLSKLTFALGFHGGLAFAPGGPNAIKANDRFFIGGPLTLRGFDLNSVGNKSVSDYYGSTGYWIAGAHIYAPLPFCWSRFGRGQWLDNFRSHVFVNAGNAFEPDLRETATNNARSALSNVRLSCGLGLVYRFMRSARFELNFCYPLRAAAADKLCDGIQFGIGVSSV